MGEVPNRGLPPGGSAAGAVRRRTLRLAGAAAVITVAAGGWLACRPSGPSSTETPRSSESPPAGDVPLPALAASPFVNTAPGARYVGSDACRDCHQESHQSYSRSGMSRSMAEVDPEREPDDTVFEHAVSGRRYTLHRQGGQLRLRDELTGVSGYGDVVLADHPLRYVVGSGHFSKTHLAEIDGFLVEAPLTWYASTGTWGMSPGYDHPVHEGFARPVIERCLACHAGASEAVEGTVQKLSVHELAIGCERCHGPGSAHIAFRNEQPGDATSALVPGEVDRTIVNPARLSRELAEAVCEQCHLTASAEITSRGRTLADFRPGLPLHDYMQFFRRKEPETSMKVIGHVDQLALSRCYRESATLTCITCHSPHAVPAREERAAHYRAICLNCHEPPDCRVDPAVRVAQSTDNNCVKCHMPVGPTEIVHLAFTHHRIGIHELAPTDAGGETGPAADVMLQLESVHDLSPLGEIDRQRALGLAYYDHAWLEGGDNIDRELQQAKSLLEEVRRLGLREGQVDAALAQIGWFTGDPLAPVLAREALADPLLPADPRSGVLSILATNHLNCGELQPAIEHARELLRMRRNAPNWILMGNCELKRNNLPAATAAFEQAVAVDVRQIAARRTLAQLYGVAGRKADARREWAIADRLESIMNGRPQPDESAGPSQ